MKYLVIGGCSHAVGTGLKFALGHSLEGGVNVSKIYRYSKEGKTSWKTYLVYAGRT